MMANEEYDINQSLNSPINGDQNIHLDHSTQTHGEYNTDTISLENENSETQYDYGESQSYIPGSEQIDSEHKDQTEKNDKGHPDAKLFIGGMSWDTTEDNLTSHFSHYGTISDVVVMKEPYTNRPRGFGFVHFTSPDSAGRALEVQHTINGKVVEVKRAQPRDRKDGASSSNNPPDESALKVFVGGVGPGLTEDDLKEFFNKYGNVLKVHIMTDKETGRPRGFAFVDYGSTSSVEQALKYPEITVKDKPLQVKPAVARQTNKNSHQGNGGYGRSGYNSRSSGGPTRHRSSNYGRNSNSAYSQYAPSNYGSSYGSGGSRYPYSAPTSRHTSHMNPAAPSYGSYYPDYSTDPSAGYAPSPYSYTAPVPSASSYPPPPRQSPYVPPSGTSTYPSALGAPDDRYRYASAVPAYGSAPRYPNPPVSGTQPMPGAYGRPPQASGGHSRSSYGSNRGRSHHGYHPYSR